MATFDPAGMQDWLVSHALASGVFSSVNGHEATDVPDPGITAAGWLSVVMPAPMRSGLAVTSARSTWMVRAHLNLFREPRDAIDPALLSAMSTLLGLYMDDLTITNAAGDLLGEFDPMGYAGGQPFQLLAGYLEIGKKHFRTLDLSISIATDDCWAQGRDA